MPTTIVRPVRIDAATRQGPHGAFQDFLISGCVPNGPAPETLEFQAHTTSVFAAAVCQRAIDLGQNVAALWRDHRFGKQLVDVKLLPKDQTTAVA